MVVVHGGVVAGHLWQAARYLTCSRKKYSRKSHDDCTRLDAIARYTLVDISKQGAVESLNDQRPRLHQFTQCSSALTLRLIGVWTFGGRDAVAWYASRRRETNLRASAAVELRRLGDRGEACHSLRSCLILYAGLMADSLSPLIR